MARQPALNIADYTNQATMDNLAEVLDGVIENIQVSAVSEALKNTNGSGNPEGGSVEYKRFVNATLIHLFEFWLNRCINKRNSKNSRSRRQSYS